MLRPHARPGAWIWTGSALAVLLASSEYLTWRASKDLVPADRTDPGTVDPGEVILVLGCPANSRGRVSFVQRWRVRIAVRSTDPGEARFVFTGANLRGHTSEAAAMARYAVEVLGVPATSVVLEEQSTSTWENIAYSLPLIDDATSIKIASNTFHARRARRYLAMQAPQLAGRLRRARDFLPGELAPLKLLLVGYEWRRARRERQAGHSEPSRPAVGGARA